MSCNHNCATCKEKCSTPTNMVVETAKENNIKKIIGVVSGKGGVGKSTVTSLLAVEMAKKGYKNPIKTKIPLIPIFSFVEQIYYTTKKEQYQAI